MMKKAVLLLICLALTLCACGKQAPAEGTEESCRPTAGTSAAPTCEVPLDTGSWTLFETVFLPIAEGKIGFTLEEVTAFLGEQGWEWSEGEGMLSVPDPERPGSFLSGNLTTVHENVELAALSYHYVIAEGTHIDQRVQRVVEVNFMGGSPRYCIALDWQGKGTPVETPDELARYMMTPALRPEETPVGVYQAKMLGVLSGEECYTAIDGIRGLPAGLTLEDYLEAFPISAAFTKVAAADMDGDGFDELVLSIVADGHEEETGVLVLHYQDRMVFGQTYYHRQMNTLKADGTFDWSGGASHWGTGRLTFGTYDPYIALSEYTWETRMINMCDCPDDGNYTFLADGREADEAVFYEAIAAQEAKKDARWVRFAEYSKLFG